MKLSADRPLSQTEMMDAMDAILNGRLPEEDVIHFLTALSERGETEEEIAGAALYLRNQSEAISAPTGAVDCCGTGGDGQHTYNISTAVALISAACGVPVAKHGNRAASSKCGAADVLEACGVRLELPRTALEDALHEFNFAFLMAPQHYPMLSQVREIRKKIGRRTLFNLLGPLLNPARTKLQLIGVYDRGVMGKMAGALKILGSSRAWIVYGADGMDEITLQDKTYRTSLIHDIISLDEIFPENFGLQSQKTDDLKGGDARTNADALIALLKGQKNIYRDTVLANAAAVLNLHGTAPDFTSGVKIAAEAIDSGKAFDTLQSYAAFSQKAKIS